MNGNDFRIIAEVNNVVRTGPDSGGGGAFYQQNRRQHKKQPEFAGILESERRSQGERSDISVRSTGYGANGRPQTIIVKMKDYTYQS